MESTRTLWISLAALLIASFAVLLFMGGEIYRKAPPLPDRVVAVDGSLLYGGADLQRGRQVWQSIGGMQLGSIWGHGGYVAADWSADWLHREAIAVLDLWAQREAGAASNTITLDADRAAAIRTVAAHYQSLFGDEPATADLREAYAMRTGTVPDAENRRALTAFFWWTAWAAATNRPESKVTYTNNWPGEPLIGNRPPASEFLWSAFSVLFLIAGIALLGWHHAVTHGSSEEPHQLPASDPLAMVRVTPSMRATAKYFWVVLALFLVQIVLGTITAHYQVEGQELYGVELAQVLPYSLTRTWHTIAFTWFVIRLWMLPRREEPLGTGVGASEG